MSVKVFWEIVYSDPELKIYFPDYKNSVLFEEPLGSPIMIKIEVEVGMIKETRIIREIDNELDEDQIVEIKKDLLKNLGADLRSSKSLQV